MKAEATAAMMTTEDWLTSPALMGEWFSGPSWAAWKAFSKAVWGEAMTPTELKVYQERTGRTVVPTRQVREAWVPVGRRGGKSLVMAREAVRVAVRDYSAILKPGARAYVLVLAADKEQAAEVMGYVSGFFENIPALAAMVEKRKGKGPSRRDEIRLTNRVMIRIAVASFRRIRGRTVVAAICDELAFWHDSEKSLNPANEILRALRPAMLTVKQPLLLVISSPYRRQGPLWDAVKQHWAKDGDPVLVWRGDTLSMNPSADREEIDRAYADDPEGAKAEYGGEFRTDLESYVSPESVDAVVVRGRLSLPYDARFRHFGFCDPAGGSGQDSMTLAIARREHGRAVVCRVVEWKPRFNPDTATAEAAEVLKEYGLTRVMGDHYAGDWPASRFRAHGITYETARLTKSDYYGAFLPLVNGQRVELLDHQKTNGQLLALERSTSKLGKDSITHPPGGHDDLVNAAAGASVLALRKPMLNSEGVAERERRSAPVPTGVIEERRRMYGGTVIVRIFPDGTEVVDRVAPESETAALEHGYRACPNYPARCHSQQHLAVEREGVLVADCPYGRPQWDVAKLARDGMPADARPDIGLRPERTGVEPVAPGKTVRWSR